MDRLAHFCHTGLDPAMDKANVLLSDVETGLLHLNPVRPSVRLGT